MTDDNAGASGPDRSDAPVDFDRLDLVRERLGSDERFADVEWRPPYAPDRVVFHYDERFYPRTVAAATLEVVRFENDDFSIHYHAEHEQGSFDHRWDRHPSAHNERAHVHPGPDAPTPGRDVSHPADWRDVLSMVLSEIEARQRAFWSE